MSNAGLGEGTLTEEVRFGNPQTKVAPDVASAFLCILNSFVAIVATRTIGIRFAAAAKVEKLMFCPDRLLSGDILLIAFVPGIPCGVPVRAICATEKCIGDVLPPAISET